MTRTNGNEKFEFINWHLTFIWLTGGFIRYCILLPARLTILVIGVGGMLDLSRSFTTTVYSPYFDIVNTEHSMLTALSKVHILTFIIFIINLTFESARQQQSVS